MIDILHTEAGKLISEICSDDEVKVIVKRTNAGLTATIVLPGAVQEEEGSDNIASIHEEEDSDDKACIEDGEAEEEETTKDGEVEEEVESEYEDEAYEEEMAPIHAVRPALSEEESLENSELNEIISELMREVEKLRSQKEVLEQQVAVLSESSYI